MQCCRTRASPRWAGGKAQVGLQGAHGLFALVNGALPCLPRTPPHPQVRTHANFPELVEGAKAAIEGGLAPLGWETRCDVRAYACWSFGIQVFALRAAVNMHPPPQAASQRLWIWCVKKRGGTCAHKLT